MKLIDPLSSPVAPTMRVFDVHEAEEMDQPQPVSRRLEKSLRELEFLNHNFGGHRYLRNFLRKHFVSRRHYRVLDVATGGGDYPRVMVQWARDNEVGLRIDAIDSSAATIALAKKWSRAYPEIRFIEADALQFEAPKPYDLVYCSLSMHHFPTAAAVTVLRRLRAYCSQFVLVTDLERHWLTTLAVAVINRLLHHQEMTVHDGDISARRAFSFREFRLLAKGAGWPTFGHERFPFCRQALWCPAE